MSTDLICTDVPSERVAPSLMLAFLCREHRELLRQIAQTGSHSDSEELEQELEHLARKMESKEDQISKLQKHQDRVRALWVSNKPAFLLRKLPVLRRQNQSPHRCSITSAWPSSWECGGEQTISHRSHHTCNGRPFRRVLQEKRWQKSLCGIRPWGTKEQAIALAPAQLPFQHSLLLSSTPSWF